MEEVKVQIVNPKKDSVRVSLVEAPATGEIVVDYHTLNGNHPNANGNYIGVWVSDDGEIPPNTPAEYSEMVAYNDTDYKGLLLSFRLESKGYVLGYCLTGDPCDAKQDAYKKVCATVVIDKTYKGTVVPEEVSVTLDVTNYGPSHVISYQALENMDCSCGNWIGIWKNSEIIGNTDPLYHTDIQMAGSEGKVYVPSGKLIRGNKYKVGFFMDGYGDNKPTSYKSLAALFSFQVD